MDYVYIICVAKNFDEGINNFILHSKNMIKSLNSNCNCTLIVNTLNISDSLFKFLTSDFSNEVIHYKIPKKEWINYRMFSKINRLLKMGFKHGDNVFVLDTDLMVQDDIFKVFEKGFDIYYTTRHYKHVFPINAGVWGFNYNCRSEKFLRFYIEQMINPTWFPYVEFCNKFKRSGLDWWCDQDFLCAVYNNKEDLPIECKILDIGSKYNFCGDTDVNSFEIARKQIMDKIGNTDYKILHFKGLYLKKILAEL